jgi:hypothetical protein
MGACFVGMITCTPSISVTHNTILHYTFFVGRAFTLRFPVFVSLQYRVPYTIGLFSTGVIDIQELSYWLSYFCVTIGWKLGHVTH